MEVTGELTFADLLAKVRQFSLVVWVQRWVVARSVIIACVFGLVYALGAAEEFSANIRILPYRSTSGGGLSGLAGLAGVRLPGGSVEQTITADLYPELISSIDFRIAVAESPLAFASLPRKATSVEYFRDLRRPSLVATALKYTVGLPRLLLNKSRATGSTKNQQPADSVGFRSLDPAYVSLVESIGARVAISVDRKTSVIVISGTMPDPVAAANLVKVTSDKLVERIMSFESRKAAEQFEFVQKRYDEAEERFNRSHRELALFTDRNRSLMSAVSRIDEQRLQREYDLSFEMLQQFSRDREQARIKMNQDTPIFAVLEDVRVPTYRTSPKRARIMVLSAFLGFTVGVGLVGLRSLRAGHL